MKKLFGFLTILLIGALVACGGSDSTDEPTEVLASEVDSDTEGEYSDEIDSDTDDSATDPLATDNEVLVNWIGDLIAQIEGINVEDGLMFTATTGGIISGTRSTMAEVNASAYLDAQIENVISFIEEVQTFVVQNFDNDELDLVEARDIMIETLITMREIFSEE